MSGGRDGWIYQGLVPNLILLPVHVDSVSIVHSFLLFKTICSFIDIFRQIFNPYFHAFFCCSSTNPCVSYFLQIEGLAYSFLNVSMFVSMLKVASGLRRGPRVHPTPNSPNSVNFNVFIFLLYGAASCPASVDTEMGVYKCNTAMCWKGVFSFLTQNPSDNLNREQVSGDGGHHQMRLRTMSRLDEELQQMFRFILIIWAVC